MRYLILIFLSSNVFGQTTKLDTVFCDCDVARVITLSGNKKIGKTIAPPGPGINNEIGTSKVKGRYAFDKEHHVAWYKLVMATSGNFIFDIIPSKASDDYDFMLFKASKNFCDSLHNFQIKPLRSCISRDREDIFGRTGLNLLAKKELVNEGVGDAYCAYIEVTKGEIYYLVLDNVYAEGDGHTIQFSFGERVEMRGVIKDENSKPVEAEITLVDQKGDTVLTTASNKEGIYGFIAPLKRNVNYSMNFYNGESFTYSKSLNISDTIELKHLVSVLPKLKKGSKHSVGSINFYPGQSKYLPLSAPAMMNLYKLLKKNKKLKIMIIGHSNGRDWLNEEENINFTKDRARSIRNFLVEKGIDGKRIRIDGKGDHEMLFQLPEATQQQQVMNRRVEVMVLEY